MDIIVRPTQANYIIPAHARCFCRYNDCQAKYLEICSLEGENEYTSLDSNPRLHEYEAGMPTSTL
jgi:hypothetical protein